MGILVRYDDPEAVDHPLYARFATVTPGAPGRCPECDAFGYIDHADLARSLQSQSCRGCGYRWEYAFDAEGHIASVRELPGCSPSWGAPAAGSGRDDTVIDLRPAGRPAAPPRRSSGASVPPSR